MAPTVPAARQPLDDLVLFGPDNKPIPRASVPAGDRQGFETSTEPLSPRFPGRFHPRTYDVPTGANANLTARGDGRRWLQPFEQLRSLADFDLVRIVIEDVKGQIRGMAGGVQAKKGADDKSDEVRDQIATAEAWVRKPDPLAGLEFDDWMGCVLEEILVTDALALYPQTSRGGDPLGLVQIDGTTIKPIVDDAGRPPLPPAPAYQQMIWGLPETEFGFGELWYLPRNRRANSPYGRSPVENVIVTINLAIRTSLHELAFYTDGTLPDSLFATPKGWSPSQVEEFQEFFDGLLGGDSGRRSGGLRFVPGGEGVNYWPTKDHRVKYEQLEYLARVIAWSFGVSPLPIAKMMNRATGDTLETSSIESGPRPLSQFAARILTRYFGDVLGLDLVEYVYGLDEAEDPGVAYQRSVAFVREGIATVDEARKEHGLPARGFDELVAQTPGGPVFVEDILEQRNKAREDAAKGDDAPATSGVDPTLIQRAFLEVPIFRRDELRQTLGLEPIGGEEGQQIVTISNIGGGAPVQSGPATLPADEDGSLPTGAPPSTGEGDPDEEADVTGEDLSPFDQGAAKAVTDDLARWRRMAIRKVKQGDPVRYFVTDRVPVVLQARLLAALRRVRRVDQVDAVFAKADPSPVGQADAQARLFESLTGWLQARLPDVTAWALAELETRRAAVADVAAKLRKAVDEASINFPVGLLDVGLDDLFPELSQWIGMASTSGVEDVGASLGLDLVSAPATSSAFAQARAAELVGRRLVDGVLVPNPDPRWLITEDLRFDIRRTVASAIDQGWSPGRLTRELQDTLGAARAETIARTETAFAYGHGAQEAFEEAGAEFVEIVDGPGCLPSGHKNKAPLPSKTPGVVQPSSQANGQVWTLEQYRARTIGHPRCVRAAVLHVEGDDPVPQQ